jgi:hypothetical protein
MERLPTLCTMGPGRKISYSEVIAFHNIIREMDTVERIITHAVRKSRDGRIDLSDFLNEAAGSMRYGMFTPMEANIIWHFASRGGMGSNQRLGLNDFQALLDAKVSVLRCDAGGGRGSRRCPAGGTNVDASVVEWSFGGRSAQSGSKEQIV